MNDNREGVNKFLDSIYESARMIIDYNYELSELYKFKDEMYKRYCPFKVGDTVILVKEPVINEKQAWGWLHAKHFLKIGAVGIVKEVGFYDGKFRAGVKFLNETYIDSNTKKEIQLEKPHMYMFSEDFLKTCEGVKNGTL